MTGTMQPIYTTVGGRRYQVFMGSDDRYYLFDPNHTLDTHALQTSPHQTLPGLPHEQAAGLHGLGAGEQAYIGVAATAASFVPVVGPVLGPLIGAIGSLFGGGDPTPASSIWKAIIDAREAVAQTKNAIAGSPPNPPVDTFVVPPGLVRTSDGPNGGNTGNVLASKICAEVLSLPSSDIHKVKRAQWYACLQTLQKELQQLQGQQHDMQLTQQITQQIIPTVPSTQTVAAPTQPITQPVLSPYTIPQAALPSQSLPAVAYPPSILAQGAYPSAYPPSYTQPSASVLSPSTSGMTQMLPYLMIGGMFLVMLMSRGSSERPKHVSR